MARVTVEDCIDKVDSPYELVLVAKERATQLNTGIEPTLDRDNDKNTVIALREIAEENIKVADLTESAVPKLMRMLVMILKVYIKVRFQKVEHLFYHLKEHVKLLKKFKFLKMI